MCLVHHTHNNQSQYHYQHTDYQPDIIQLMIFPLFQSLLCIGRVENHKLLAILLRVPTQWRPSNSVHTETNVNMTKAVSELLHMTF